MVGSSFVSPYSRFCYSYVGDPMIANAFLICALALPVTSIPSPKTSLFTMESGSIKVARMLMLSAKSNNRNVLLIGTYHDWTYFLRESGYSAWRVTMDPEFRNDIMGTTFSIPIKPHSMILTVFASEEPKDITTLERVIRQLTSTLAVNGFLVFDGVLCPTIFRYLSPFNWRQVPVPSHEEIRIFQRIDIFGDYKNGERFLSRARRGLNLIRSDKAYYLTWDRNTWMHILSRRITQYDHNTFDHSSRVATLMVNFGRYLGWSNGDLEDGRYAAWLHDYGKIAISKSILLKPASLTDDEWLIMRTHASWGMKLLSRVPAFRGVAQIVVDHHEHFDGTGYPAGKRGDEISKVARALSIVDSYDVIVNDRPYKQAKTPTWAAWELRRCAGTQFDPELVEKFLIFMRLRLTPRFLEPPMYKEMRGAA